MDVKKTLADEAVRIVTGARRAAYGRPEQNFERIARLWNAHMLNTQRDGNLTAVDVATFCRLIKEARLAETPDHRDSFVDILGYTLCQAEIALTEAVIAPSIVPHAEITKSWADAALADNPPPWKRAKVGDMVLLTGSTLLYRVHAVDEGSEKRLQVVNDDCCASFTWVDNNDVLSVEYAA